MRKQTEYMSFKNRSTISSSYDFQKYQQCSDRRSRFSQTGLQWFKMFLGLFQVLPGTSGLVVGTPRHVVGTPRLVIGAPRLVARVPRCYQVCPKFSPALWGVFKLITITPMVLLYQSSEIPVTLNAGWNAILGSDTLLKLTHLSLHSTSSQILLEASSNENTFCWWLYQCRW